MKTPMVFSYRGKDRYCPSVWCYAVIATDVKISMLAHPSLYFSISFTTVRTMLEMDYEERFIEPENEKQVLNFYKMCKVLRIKGIISICT